VIESRCVLTGPPATLTVPGFRPGRDLGHGLVWTLFDEAPGASRDFLYLVERQRPLTVIVRSARPPRPGGLWTVERSYPFRPVLETSQVLAFRVTCVPVTWTRTAASSTTKRQDVIMAAWKRLPNAAREDPEQLAAAADKAALDWLGRQGVTRGFELPRGPGLEPAKDLCLVEVIGYDRRRLPRGRGRGPATFGSVTFEGLLRVTDAKAFRRLLGDGLGAARAFGMGLMQIAQPRLR
jgi:CRISPR system Cascade subunit CasE